MTDSGEVDGRELVNIGTINVRTSGQILDCFLLRPNHKPKHVCIIYTPFLYSFCFINAAKLCVCFTLSIQSV